MMLIAKQVTPIHSVQVETASVRQDITKTLMAHVQNVSGLGYDTFRALMINL